MPGVIKHFLVSIVGVGCVAYPYVDMHRVSCVVRDEFFEKCPVGVILNFTFGHPISVEPNRYGLKTGLWSE